MRNVEKLNPDDSVENFFLIHRATQGITVQGKDYMTLYLQDKSGNIETKLWTVTKDDMKIPKPKIIVWVRGDVISYRSRKQVKVNQFRLVTAEDGVRTRDFVDDAPLSPNETQGELSHFILEIESAHLQRITRHLLKKYRDKFFTCPAASSHHHNFAGRLSYHVLTVLRIARSLCDIYPLLNRSLLYNAIILHDISKVRELSGPVTTTYTVEGDLLGHISVVSDEVAETAKELGIDNEGVVLLRHVILTHHGKMEFGSPRLPHPKETEILFFIDNIDAKMSMFDKAFRKTEKGQSAERTFGMNNRQSYNLEKLD